MVRGHRGLSIRQGSAHGRIVCTLPWRDADDEARARLIAQAWPLLLNLHRLAEIVGRFQPRELFEPELNDALEVIALASRPRPARTPAHIPSGPAGAEAADHRPASAEALAPGAAGREGLPSRETAHRSS